MDSNARNAKLYEVMAGRGDDVPSSAIKRTLQVIRGHLGMDVAYLSRFEGDNWVLRDVDAASADVDLLPGQTLPRAETICGNVADGRLPAVISDLSALPLGRRLKAAAALGIGAHLAAPIILDGGDATNPWGMLCCYAFKPDASLNERDLSLLEAFSDIVAYELGRELAEDAQTQESLTRVTSLLAENDGMVALLQPIWELSRGSPWGAEALCRIVSEPKRSPDFWFAEADSVSLRADLELAALEKALAALPHLDEALVLSLNVSPGTILTPGFGRLLGSVPSHRLLLELTEHLPVDDYDELRAALAPLRGAGLRIAVDDAGGGYASMTHILQLQPDIIKADMALTRDIDSDRAKQALVAALVGFAHATRATLLAEGIETAAELAELKALGVTLGQGYLLGRPTRPQDLETAFAYGAAAFRPALIRGRDLIEAPPPSEYASLLDARRKYATAVDPRLARWVV